MPDVGHMGSLCTQLFLTSETVQTKTFEKGLYTTRTVHRQTSSKRTSKEIGNNLTVCIRHSWPPAILGSSTPKQKANFPIQSATVTPSCPGPQQGNTWPETSKTRPSLAGSGGEHMARFFLSRRLTFFSLTGC